MSRRRLNPAGKAGIGAPGFRHTFRVLLKHSLLCTLSTTCGFSFRLAFSDRKYPGLTGLELLPKHFLKICNFPVQRKRWCGGSKLGRLAGVGRLRRERVAVVVQVDDGGCCRGGECMLIMSAPSFFDGHDFGGKAVVVPSCGRHLPFNQWTE